MTDSKLFKSALVARGITMYQLAEQLGISNATLSYKVNGSRQFMLKEVALIQKILDLTDEERDKIFFA